MIRSQMKKERVEEMYHHHEIPESLEYEGSRIVESIRSREQCDRQYSIEQ